MSAAADTRTETRAHQHELTIDASPETVWKAITEAEEITRWFAFDAAVTPGPHGTMTYRWGDLENTGRIEAWETERHLRTGWMDPVDGADGETKRFPTAVDWYLEGRGGRTTLRLVHSGFGKGADWDDEYDGTNRGWNAELRSLRHYLENHYGQERSMVWIRRETSKSPAEVWEAMSGRDGLAREGSLASVKEGDRYDVTTASGQRLQGKVLLHGAPRDLSLTVENLNRSILRLAFEDCFGKPEAHIFLSTWGLDEARRTELRSSFESWMDGLFT